MRPLHAIVTPLLRAACVAAGWLPCADVGAQTVQAAPVTPAAQATAVQAPAALAGSPERGQALLLRRHDSGCILCHEVPGIAQGGNLGPPLGGMAARYSADELRARIADARAFNPQTIMPPTRSTAGLQRVAPGLQGQTLLTQQALEDIVAYLMVAPAAEASAR